MRWPTPSRGSNWADLQGELGDLLLQIGLSCADGRRGGACSALPDVMRAIADKMVARHPHVFGDESRDKTAEQQTADWESDQGRRARCRCAACWTGWRWACPR